MIFGQMSAQIVQIDLSHPLPGVRAERPHDTLWILIRRGALPLGWIRCDVAKFGGHIAPDLLGQLIAERLAHVSMPITVPTTPSIAGHHPFVSIIICHQGSSAQLQRTLQSIAELKYRNYEAIVIGSAGGDAEAKGLCATYP